MVLIKILVLNLLLENAYSLKYTKHAQSKFIKICMDMVKDPCYNDELVTDKVWNTYYSWNFYLEGDNCMTMSFRKANDAQKKRYQLLMERVMTTEIDWSKAKIISTFNWTEDAVKMSSEILLFPIATDKGDNVGLFRGIPRLIKQKKNSLKRVTGLLPEPSLALKLFNKNRHLLVADCQAGVVQFLVRQDQKHTWKEIDAAVDSFDFGGASGFPSCKYSFRRRPKRKL